MLFIDIVFCIRRLFFYIVNFLSHIISTQYADTVSIVFSMIEKKYLKHVSHSSIH